MKAISTATASLRAATRSATNTVAIRCSSSEAGPSSVPALQPTPKNSRRLPRSVLRNLVELHHHSSTFLTDPATIPEGFKVAFNALHTPTLTTYDAFTETAHKLHARRGLAGLENLRDKYKGGAGAMYKEADAPPEPARVSRSAWTGEDSWAESSGGMLSEREARVKEALFGTWERSAGRMGRETVDVGLDGVEEHIQAKGQNVEEVAKMWYERDQAV